MRAAACCMKLPCDLCKSPTEHIAEAGIDPTKVDEQWAGEAHAANV